MMLISFFSVNFVMPDLSGLVHIVEFEQKQNRKKFGMWQTGFAQAFLCTLTLRQEKPLFTGDKCVDAAMLLRHVLYL
jgi:hypothetical protein